MDGMGQKDTYMRRAIELALLGKGRTSPNPMVGAVVVKDDDIIGEGYHAKAGEPHAEVHALREAGEAAKGADLYVTLEPCCHEGRTPPCADAIVRAGIARVFIGAGDPNPQVDGKGIALLCKAGVEVELGVMSDACRAINEAYNKFMDRGIPFVTAKVALTLDGKIAANSGDSKWITNEECRRFVHELRARSDAVIVGGGTVRSDDPRLDVRLEGDRDASPKAVVLDEALDIPKGARLLSRQPGGLICITTASAPDVDIDRIRSQGHEVIVCEANGEGFVDVGHALAELGRRGIASLLLEGGGRIFASFAAAGMIDRLIACVAPKLMGGGGKDFLPGLKCDAMKDAIELERVNFGAYGDNMVMDGYPKWR